MKELHRVLERLAKLEGLLDGLSRRYWPYRIPDDENGEDIDRLKSSINQLSEAVDALTQATHSEFDSIRPDRKQRDRGNNGGNGSGSTPDGPNGPDGNEPGAGHGGGTPFWANYLVRYIGGTFVGIVCLGSMLVLNPQVDANSPRIKDLFEALGNDASWLVIALIIGIGFTFSYIASAPIYVLHLLRRFLYLTSDDEESDQPASSKSSISAYVNVVVVCFFVVTMLLAIFYQANESGVEINFVLQLGASLLFLVILLVQLIPIMKLFSFNGNMQKAFEDFYYQLADKRVPPGKNARRHLQDYAESYRHLREHGNASLIVICNILLAIIVSVAANMQVVAGIIVLWVIPASIGWFAATLLETAMLRRRWQGP